MVIVEGEYGPADDGDNGGIDNSMVMKMVWQWQWRHNTDDVRSSRVYLVVSNQRRTCAFCIDGKPSESIWRDYQISSRVPLPTRTTLKKRQSFLQQLSTNLNLHSGCAVHMKDSAVKTYRLRSFNEDLALPHLPLISFHVHRVHHVFNSLLGISCPTWPSFFR